MGSSAQFSQNRLLPVDGRLSFFMPDWEFVTPVLSSRWSGVLSPFCEESATGDRSCRDSIAQTAVQAGSSVGRGFIPPSLEGLEDY